MTDSNLKNYLLLSAKIQPQHWKTGEFEATQKSH